MIKKESTNSSRISIGFRCGECVHHMKFPKFEKPCFKLGVTSKALAPSCFSPNVFILQRHSPDVLNQLGLLIRDFSASQSRILLALLKSKKAFKKLGLAFGLPVYVRFGKDFLSNYYKGYVVGVSPHGEPTVYVVSDINKKQASKPAMLALMPDSIYTITRFKKKRQELKKNKRLIDNTPGFLSVERKKKIDENYEPPTLENAPASWFDVFSKKTSAKKLKRNKDGSLKFKV